MKTTAILGEIFERTGDKIQMLIPLIMSTKDLPHSRIREETTIQNSHGIVKCQKYNQIEPDQFIYTSAPSSGQVSRLYVASDLQ